jgi:hypothetical protein
MSKHDDYEVGYGKPPKHTRFAKGASGNPSGRPKGSKNLATHIHEAIHKKVRVNTENGVRHITKLEATLMQLLNLALGGKNRQAIRDVLQLAQLAEQTAENEAHVSIQDHRDQPVIKNLMKRIRESENNEPDTPEEP